MRYTTAPIILLDDEWHSTLARWKEYFKGSNRKEDVPAVFIIVCHDTSIARVMYNWLAGGDLQYGHSPVSLDKFSFVVEKADCRRR